MTTSLLIKRASDAFRETHRGLHNPLVHLEAKFKGRGISFKDDLAKFRTYCEDYTRSVVVAFKSDFDLKKSDPTLQGQPSAAFISVGFAPFERDEKTRMVVPRMHLAVLSPIMFSKVTRNMPIGFEIQKTEFDYIRNTAETLNYSEESTQSAFVLALALSKVLEQKLTIDGQRTRIALPHPEGLLMGYAERVPKDQQYWNAEALHLGRGGGRPTNLTPVYQWENYDIAIHLQKFVHPRRLTEAQLELWRNSLDLIGENRKEQIDAVWYRFACITAKSDFKDQEPGAHALEADVEKLVNSDVWKTALGLKLPRPLEIAPHAALLAAEAENIVQEIENEIEDEVEAPEDGLMRFMMRSVANPATPDGAAPSQ